MPLLLQASISSTIENNNPNINYGNLEANDFENMATYQDFYLGYIPSSQKSSNFINYQFILNKNNFKNSNLNHNIFYNPQNYYYSYYSNTHLNNLHYNYNFDNPSLSTSFSLKNDFLSQKINPIVVNNLLLLISIFCIFFILSISTKQNFFKKWKFNNFLYNLNSYNKIKLILLKNTIINSLSRLINFAQNFKSVLLNPHISF